jgi:hypothetical protein
LSRSSVASISSVKGRLFALAELLFRINQLSFEIFCCY